MLLLRFATWVEVAFAFCAARAILQFAVVTWQAQHFVLVCIL